MGDVLFWPALALIACVAAVVFISVVRLRKLRHTIEHHMPEAVVRVCVQLVVAGLVTMFFRV